MNYEELSPGDGRTYPIFWCYAKDLVPVNPAIVLNKMPNAIVMGTTNGALGSGFVKGDEPFVDIAEKFSCTGDQALMILHFAKEKVGLLEETESQESVKENEKVVSGHGERGANRTPDTDSNGDNEE